MQEILHQLIGSFHDFLIGVIQFLYILAGSSAGFFSINSSNGKCML